MNKHAYILISIIVLVVIVIILSSKNNMNKNIDQKDGRKDVPAEEVHQTTVPRWQAYTDANGRFKFQYPSDWKIVETNMDNPPALIEVVPSDTADIYARDNSFIIFDRRENEPGTPSTTDWIAPLGNSSSKYSYYPEQKLTVVMTSEDDNRQILDKILSTFSVK